LLSHPFLPFITEELWQRLPRRPNDDTASIMIARYPTYDEGLDNAPAEAAYQLVLDCSAAIRSLKAEFPSKDEAQSTCPSPSFFVFRFLQPLPNPTQLTLPRPQS